MKHEPTNQAAEDAWKRHEAGDSLGAIALLTQALAQRPREAASLLYRAKIFAAMGCPNEAEADLDTLLEETPPGESAEEAFLLKGRLRMGAGDARAALYYYNKVKEADPQRGEAYVGMSMAHAALHQLGRALATMDEALALLPHYADGYKERGRIKYLLHDAAGAMDDLKRALSLSPDTAKDLAGRFTNLPTGSNESDPPTDDHS